VTVKDLWDASKRQAEVIERQEGEIVTLRGEVQELMRTVRNQVDHIGEVTRLVEQVRFPFFFIDKKIDSGPSRFASASTCVVRGAWRVPSCYLRTQEMKMAPVPVVRLGLLKLAWSWLRAVPTSLLRRTSTRLLGLLVGRGLRFPYVSRTAVVDVVDEIPILTGCLQVSTSSDGRRLLEVRRNRVLTTSWVGLETPPRPQSPGRLGDLPQEGPPLRFSVEQRFVGGGPGIGWESIVGATEWERAEEAWVNAMVEDQD
jgi:hypothetical protein